MRPGATEIFYTGTETIGVPGRVESVLSGGKGGGLRPPLSHVSKEPE